MVNKRQLALILILLIVLAAILVKYPDKTVESIQIVGEELGSELLRSPRISPEKISIEKIFDGINSKSEDPNEWSLLVGGDVMIGRTVNYKTLTYRNFDWPYVKISDLFSAADYTLVNLESPVIENCPIKNDGMIFCGDVRHTAAMARAGIDGVSLANNHMLNKGKDGLQTTISYLRQNNIAYIGAPNPTYINIKNQKVAFLGYTDVECYEGVACVDFEKIKSDISMAKENSDLVVVMYHWGAEYQDYPTERQKETARLSIDSGADLILGNHPHWIQPFEVYKDKLIMYSHGNLVFDQMWSQKTREGILAEYIFRGNELIDVELHPLLIEDYGQPFLLDGSSKTSKIEFIQQLSENMAKETN